jgi:inositol transporter-like SP family MFS transporter
MNTKTKYRSLLVSAGLGSILGSGIIVGLSSTITVWQKGLSLSNSNVGLISGALTFSIAAGSLLAGKISKSMGLIKSFNILGLIFSIGTVVSMFAQNFMMLIIGAVISGFASGADLPISLSVISHDAPDDKTSAELVSSTQVYWTIGIILATLMAFATSTLAGAMSGRIEMAMLTVIGLFTFFIRNTNKNLKAIHDEGNKKTTQETTEKVSITKILFGPEKKKYLGFLISILVFYCGWNLLANTFGQFQTFMLVKAHATQTFATGAGIVLNVVCLIVAALFSKIAGGKNRNVAFIAGIIIMIAALVGLANSGSSLYLIVAWIALQNVGSTSAGESMYKVWTQESFPDGVRAGVQGFINGFSRLLCALFALITPTLVLPENIKTTMIGFAGLIFVAGLFGLNQMRLQKKYHVGKN